MGLEKLSTIREKLWQAIAAAGEDPIQWCERRIAETDRQGGDSSGLVALKRVFERGAKETGGQGGKHAPNGKSKKVDKRPDVLAELDAVTRALERATAKKPRPRKAKAKA